MGEDKKAVAYLCPDCGQSVVVERDAVQLLGGASELPCPCGKSTLTIRPEGDRVALTVPCPFCGGTHTAHCPARAILEERAVAVSCAASGLDCCLIGSVGAVFQGAARMEEAADKLPAAGAERGAFLDEILMEEILGEIRDIAGRGGISCQCGGAGWKLEVHYSSVEFICAACGGALRLAAASADDLDDLCCKDRLVIRKKI